jgi:LytS/YehU family sensor histidine kinase
LHRPATIRLSRQPCTTNSRRKGVRRWSCDTHGVNDAGISVYRINLLSEARQQQVASFSRSSSAFGRPFAVFFVTLGATLFALVAERIIPVHLAIVAVVALPVIAAVCAVPVAKLLERRFEMRHRRELSEVRRRQQEANLRLLLLQAQIEPHFLFNTLASLRALIREDVDQAEGLVDALVDHLRAVLPRIRGDVGASTLSDQIAICASYLGLMSIRLDGRLSYGIDVPDSLQNAIVPPLMLLTLVENAIKHGIEPKSDAGDIRIEARLSLDPAQIIIAVTDDGVGLTDTANDGLGLQNLREQLALRYGSRASLSLVSPAAGGTIASLLIPHELAQST